MRKLEFRRNPSNTLLKIYHVARMILANTIVSAVLLAVAATVSASASTHCRDLASTFPKHGYELRLYGATDCGFHGKTLTQTISTVNKCIQLEGGLNQKHGIKSFAARTDNQPKYEVVFFSDKECKNAGAAIGSESIGEGDLANTGDDWNFFWEERFQSVWARGGPP
ncbi:hypothetical protein BJ138DRAFT_1165392 [Hygrophoropsis aurantiaca]|uniref:Uncharacterized protein n=1 Tax=Hygrophoropsis aurantiaca TaxID=72124 RepID=A0ACB7ZW44_9AGAM|nr:hypothetical protein BJ138DRAFT_1165392 [Hygrophoropsis aurantiaca]